MRYETIADIYSANQKIREGLKATLAQIQPDELTALPDGEKWSIQQIVEHVAMVDSGTARICGKLLEGAKAAGKSSDGTATISADFGEKIAAIADLKVEAPERVQPTGNVTIAESFEKMSDNREAFDEMRADLERFDLSEPKFAHPYFGDITAAEWLIVAGGHELRHTKQIEKLLYGQIFSSRRQSAERKDRDRRCKKFGPAVPCGDAFDA